MGWFLRHPLPRSLPPCLHALVYSHPLKRSRIYDLSLNTVKYSKSDRMPLLWSCSYMSPFCWPPCLRDSSCGLCEVHGQVGESHVARNCRRPLEFWIASRSWGHLTPSSKHETNAFSPTTARKWILPQNWEFGSRTFCSEASSWELSLGWQWWQFVGP